MRIVGIADQRPDDRPALIGDQLLQVWIAIIGRGLEVAAKGRLRIGDEGRPIQMAVVLDQERPIIGNQFGNRIRKIQNDQKPRLFDLKFCQRRRFSDSG
jgi:hypothetical protein